MKVKELKNFLSDYEDDDDVLTMIHSNVFGSKFKMFIGYFDLKYKDDEGNPVLLVKKSA